MVAFISVFLYWQFVTCAYLLTTLGTSLNSMCPDLLAFGVGILHYCQQLPLYILHAVLGEYLSVVHITPLSTHKVVFICTL